MANQLVFFAGTEDDEETAADSTTGSSFFFTATGRVAFCFAGFLLFATRTTVILSLPPAAFAALIKAFVFSFSDPGLLSISVMERESTRSVSPSLLIISKSPG